MEQYIVTGMSCAACQARVEKAVAKVPGVDSVSVSLLTNSMGVEGNASSAEIIRAVEAAGYGASMKGAPAGQQVSDSLAAQEEALQDRETPKGGADVHHNGPSHGGVAAAGFPDA